MGQNKKITDLPSASSLTGAELVEVVQSGDNKKATTQSIADLAGGGGGEPLFLAFEAARVLKNSATTTIFDWENGLVNYGTGENFIDLNTGSAYSKNGAIFWTFSNDSSDAWYITDSSSSTRLDVVKDLGITLKGTGLFLNSVATPIGTAGIVGIDSSGKLFTTTGGSGLSPTGTDIGATSQIQSFELGIGGLNPTANSLVWDGDNSVTLTSRDTRYLKIDGINNSAEIGLRFGKVFSVDQTNGSYAIGDLDAVANSTKTTWDDVNEQVITRANNLFLIQSGDYIDGLFSIDGVNGIVRIGDYDPDHNGTLITVNDTDETINFKADSGFNFTGGRISTAQINDDADNKSLVIQGGNRQGWIGDGSAIAFDFTSLGASIADATDSTDVITQLNTLLAQIRTVAPFITA